jgi:hypothetical protein
VVFFIYMTGPAPRRRVRGAREQSGSTYVAAFIGYVGLATPQFLLALVLM